jgi:hypothetical protein
MRKFRFAAKVRGDFRRRAGVEEPETSPLHYEITQKRKLRWNR